MFVVHQQVALMSSSYSKMRLLIRVNEQFSMSLHLLCSTSLHLWLLIFSANNSGLLRQRDVGLSSFNKLVLYTFCLCSHINFIFLTTRSWAAITSWTVCHITALIVLHYFTSVVINIWCKQQRCWKIKTFLSHLSIARPFPHSVRVPSQWQRLRKISYKSKAGDS